MEDLQQGLDDDDDDDDDDDVQETRTGPYAVRADIEHEVSHDANNSHFKHVFSTYEDGRRQARANQGVWP